MNKSLYDDYNSCNSCGKVTNEVIPTHSEPCYGIIECKTVCSSCGHEEYWAGGYYENKGNCCKYYFDNGRKIYESVYRKRFEARTKVKQSDRYITITAVAAVISAPMALYGTIEGAVMFVVSWLIGKFATQKKSIQNY